MEIPVVKRVSATDETFRALHDMIIAGQLKPGDKLPPQDKLAQQFGVSRNTVREAINKLLVMGLLTVKQGVGTLINFSSASGYMAALSDHLFLQPSTVREFLEARVIIELATVRLSVLRADQNVIAALETNVQKQKEVLQKGDVESFVQLDVEFHTGLAEASGNKVLVQFLGAVNDLLRKFIREVSSLPRATQNALEFHRDILKSIRARDVDAAENSILNHLNDVVKNIAKNTGMELWTTFDLMAGKRDVPAKSEAPGCTRGK